MLEVVNWSERTFQLSDLNLDKTLHCIITLFSDHETKIRQWHLGRSTPRPSSSWPAAPPASPPSSSWRGRAIQSSSSGTSGTSSPCLEHKLSWSAFRVEVRVILTDPKQLLGPPLIRGKASNLADQVAHKLVVLGQLALHKVLKLSVDFFSYSQTLALLGFGLRVLGVVLCPFSRPTQISYLGAILASANNVKWKIYERQKHC